MQTHFTDTQLQDPKLAEANKILRSCGGVCFDLPDIAADHFQTAGKAIQFRRSFRHCSQPGIQFNAVYGISATRQEKQRHCAAAASQIHDARMWPQGGKMRQQHCIQRKPELILMLDNAPALDAQIVDPFPF